MDVHWAVLNSEARRALVVDMARQAPLLWIWDNVEHIAGFPVGRESLWSPSEQQELADFLRDLQDTPRALLSRRIRCEQQGCS